MTDAEWPVENWPAGIAKPPLPPGYEWSHLRPALGIGEEGEHPWFTGVTWTIGSGRGRLIKLPIKLFPTPSEAIEYAARQAWEHHSKRAGEKPMSHPTGDAQNGKQVSPQPCEAGGGAGKAASSPKQAELAECRAAFEEWHQAMYCCEAERGITGKFYQHNTAQAIWEGWQGAWQDRATTKGRNGVVSAEVVEAVERMDAILHSDKAKTFFSVDFIQCVGRAKAALAAIQQGGSHD